MDELSNSSYPLITLVQGRIWIVVLARTKSNAIERMILWLKSNLPEGEVVLACFHTDALQEAVALSKRLESALDPSESFITEMTPVI